MWHDLRQAVRTLRKHPGFVAVGALVLALGIGLNTAIFSIVSAMLFKPLPVESPTELVSIYQVSPRQPHQSGPVHSPLYDFLKESNAAFTDITAHWGISYTLRAGGETDVVKASWVLSNYFTILGVKPIMGRALSTDEDNVSTPARAVVISHALWMRRFHADPDILGKEINLALSDQVDIPFTIVGVMGPEFSGIAEPWRPTQLWITMAQGRHEPVRGWTGVAIARLRSGVTFEQAREMLAAQGHSFHLSQPKARPKNEWRVVAYRTNDVRLPNDLGLLDPSATRVPVRLAAAMTIVVAVVLLVAATNIAGILTARGVGRSGEIAIRRVLGAGPLRIVRQLLAESLLLSSIGGVLGLLLASWLLEAFRVLTPVQFAFNVPMDGRVVVFTTGVCVTAGIFVGLLPAKQAANLDVLPWLAGSGGLQTKQTRRRLRHALTVPQVACSLVLLLVAGVYVRALLRIELRDAGYQTGNLVVAYPALRTQPGERPGPRSAASMPNGQLEERYAERTRRFYRQLLDRLQAMPGAADVAVAASLPLHERRGRSGWSAVPQESFHSGEGKGVGADPASVSPGYFRTLGIALIAGRDFDGRDTTKTPKVAVVSASVAQRLWPGRDPVGRMVTMVSEFAQRGEKLESYEIVGVTRDVRPILDEGSSHPSVYFPLSQAWRPSSGIVLVRGAGDSRTLIPAIKAAVAGADSLADVLNVQTMSQMVAQILYPRRLAAAVLATSGAIALFLATIGIYGVVSYSVAQRTGEIGVRMALGAERHDIMRLVLREGGQIAAIGSLAGLVLGSVAMRITSSRYLALPEVDIATMVLTPLLLGAVVLLACYLPARRAGCVDPMEVLRRS